MPVGEFDRAITIDTTPRSKVQHSYEGLTQGLSAGIFPGSYQQGTDPLSQPGVFVNATNFNPFTLQRLPLTFGYMNLGVAQTLIDQPVDDAFRGGLIIKIPEWDEVELAKLHKTMKRQRDIHAIKQAIKWARLFGGGGLVVNTDQDPMSPLTAVSEGERLEFIAVDRWELTVNRVDTAGYAMPVPYMYYSMALDYSRVLRMLGREAPSVVRQRLQGWGMSELERCLRDIQAFYRLQSVIFELVDQAKIDVYNLQGLNDLLSTETGTQAAIARVQVANMIKSYKAAIILDKEDEYEQKVQTFGGLADIWEQACNNLAAATRIPVNKLFGQSSTGFSSGEDAMENYNALVESDVREPALPMIDELVALRCQQQAGYVPDFTVSFQPLRIADPVEEEAIKTSKQNRIIQLRQADQITGKEADEILKKDELLSIETEVGNGTREPQAMWQDASGEGQDGDGEKGKDGKAKPKKKPAAAEHSFEAQREKYEWLQAQAKSGSFRRWFSRKVDKGQGAGVVG